jgi:mannose-6-phosphate isomerase
MTPLYPLRFDPIFLEKIWGGQKIRTILHKDFGSLSNCGESWELSGVKGNVSVVSEGVLKGHSLNDLVREYRHALVGKETYERYGNDFPLLIKFIDAAEDLSIQVHPDDVLALARHDGKGKTEMWYIMDADEGATLIAGFNQSLSREDYKSIFQQGKLEEVLNKETVSQGDVFYIPAGRIHTIGKGILLAEIQQTSDITYRIYDFDRRDAKGNLRDLHTEEALDALDYRLHEHYKTAYTENLNQQNPIVAEEYFTTDKIIADREMILERKKDAFRILIGVQGEGSLHWDNQAVSLKKGDVYLIPASLDSILLKPSERMEVLEVTP